MSNRAKKNRRRRVAAIKTIEQLLRLVLPMKSQDEQIGDLLEKYSEQIHPGFGARYSRIWLWRHAASIMLGSLRRQAIMFGRFLLAGELWHFIKKLAGF